MASPESNSTANSFPKQVRLRQRSEYVRMSQTGIKYAGRHFILLVGSEKIALPRLGITVSRKVGCAVVRNRVKRLLRECFRLQRDHWPSMEMVAIARSSAAGVSFDALFQDVSVTLQRVTSS